ncbi:hypothetical protein [Alteraurantiacibacter buctensis]|uniref:Uncharacterized protein n=1 Tax=Alteraurantiacibacter buctensis TaxID=1503981 RepID=A0A844YY75_9SPHN|nr:hypothetical protein [Alteraurantiacibacter buctensis]MXO73285.1 hypothetical protein [Alteraurantiacibacter buctensis]
MGNLRIEYLAHDAGVPQRHAIDVPSVQIALIVAQINNPEGEVELWDGDRQLARLKRQEGDLSPLWKVG